jgi:hypothetical protein
VQLDAPGIPVRVTVDSRGPVSQLPSRKILQSPGVVARPLRHSIGPKYISSICYACSCGFRWNDWDLPTPGGHIECIVIITLKMEQTKAISEINWILRNELPLFQ